MSLQQLIFGIVLVVVVLGVAGWFAARTWKKLFALSQQQAPLSEAELRFYRKQAWRRYSCAILLAIVGLLLVGALVFLEGPTQRLADRGVSDPPTAEEKALFKFYSGYWIVLLLTLMSALILVSVDLFFTRQFNLRELRQVQEARKSFLEEQASELRRRRAERNGGTGNGFASH